MIYGRIGLPSPEESSKRRNETHGLFHFTTTILVTTHLTMRPIWPSKVSLAWLNHFNAQQKSE